MKIVAAILVTAVVSAAATYLVAGKTKTVEVERIVEVPKITVEETIEEYEVIKKVQKFIESWRWPWTN